MVAVGRPATTNALCHRQFHNTSSSIGITIYDDRVEIENTGHLPEELTVETIKLSHHSFPLNPTIADVLFKTTFLENWGSGIGRMIDACREANLPEPEFNQNAVFVWVTFKRRTTQPYNHASSPYNHTSSPYNFKRTDKKQTSKGILVSYRREWRKSEDFDGYHELAQQVKFCEHLHSTKFGGRLYCNVISGGSQSSYAVILSDQ